MFQHYLVFLIPKLNYPCLLYMKFLNPKTGFKWTARNDLHTLHIISSIQCRTRSFSKYKILTSKFLIIKLQWGYRKISEFFLRISAFRSDYTYVGIRYSNQTKFKFLNEKYGPFKKYFHCYIVSAFISLEKTLVTLV